MFFCKYGFRRCSTFLVTTVTCSLRASAPQCPVFEINPNEACFRSFACDELLSAMDLCDFPFSAKSSRAFAPWDGSTTERVMILDTF